MRRLPSEYVEVEYVHSSGTQYIDTGLKGNIDTELECEFAITEFNSQNLANIAGDNTTQTSAINLNFGNGTGTATIRFGNKSVPGVKDNHSTSTKYRAITNKTALTVYNADGSVRTTHLFNTVDSFTTTDTMSLFRATSSAVVGSVNIYSFKIRESNILVRDFIPVKKKSNNEYGMYDTVTKTFFGNSGTGSFTGGEVVPPTVKSYIIKNGQNRVPSEYEEVEYINNGSAGYIITNLYPSGTDKIYVKASTTDSLTANQALFGNYHDGSNTKDFVGYFGKDHFYIWRDGTQQNFVAKPQANVIYEFTADYLNGSATVKGDSVNETITFTPTTFTCNNKLPIGARHNASYGGVYAYNFYSVKYYRNNELIGDFIPVKKKSNNEYGMYDTVSKTFFGNAGSGTFTGGNTVIPQNKSYIIKNGQNRVPSEYEEVEYIETTHTTLTNQAPVIKTNIIPNQDTVCYIDYQQNQAYIKPSGGVWIFGARTSSSAGEYGLVVGSDSLYASPYNTSSGNNTFRINNSVVTNDANRHQFLFKVREDGGSSRRFDNQSVGSASGSAYVTYSEFEVDHGLWIFGCLDGDIDRQRIAMKLYSFKVWQGLGEELVANFIPVKKKSNNEYGMFDLVTKQFFGNQGSGTFTGGAVIPPSIKTYLIKEVF